MLRQGYALALLLCVLVACGQAATPAPTPAPTATAAATPTSAPTAAPSTSTPDPAAAQAERTKQLTTAIREHQTDEAQKLIAAGMNVNVVLSYRGLTPLSLAAAENDLPIATLLLTAGADVSLPNKNEYGTTALIEAAQRGYVQMVTLLLDHKADVNQRDAAGDPALNWATYYGRKAVVELLIARGANLTVVGSGGGTALKTAIARGHKEIEQILRAAGATE